METNEITCYYVTLQQLNAWSLNKYIISVFSQCRFYCCYSSATVHITCFDFVTFENFDFQIEPANEETEGIDHNTQIRSQAVISLSYQDWEVKLCMLPLNSSGCICLMKPSTQTLFFLLCQEIVKTFEISEPLIPPVQSRQRLSTWCQLKVISMGQLHCITVGTIQSILFPSSKIGVLPPSSVRLVELCIAGERKEGRGWTWWLQVFLCICYSWVKICSCRACSLPPSPPTT